MDRSTYNFTKKLFVKEIQNSIATPKELNEIVSWLKEKKFMNTYIREIGDDGYALDFIYDFGEEVMTMLNILISRNKYNDYKIEWMLYLDEPDHETQKGADLTELKISILKMILDTIEASKLKRERKFKIECLIRKYGMNYRVYLNDR